MQGGITALATMLHDLVLVSSAMHPCCWQAPGLGLPAVRLISSGKPKSGEAAGGQVTPHHPQAPEVGASGTAEGPAVGGPCRSQKRLQLKKNKFLRHAARGTVSISLTGSEFALALDRALTLDDSFQVGGSCVELQAVTCWAGQSLHTTRLHLGGRLLCELQGHHMSSWTDPSLQMTSSGGQACVGSSRLRCGTLQSRVVLSVMAPAACCWADLDRGKQAHWSFVLALKAA